MGEVAGLEGPVEGLEPFVGGAHHVGHLRPLPRSGSSGRAVVRHYSDSRTDNIGPTPSPGRSDRRTTPWTPTSLPTLSYGTIDVEYVRRLAAVEPDDDGPLWMVNLMQLPGPGRLRRRPGVRPHRPPGRRPLRPVRPVPRGRRRAGVPVRRRGAADRRRPASGTGSPWSATRHAGAFLDMQDLPEYVELHEHKDAGMASTFVIAACRPGSRNCPPTHPPSTRSPTPRRPRTAPSSSCTCSGTTRVGCPRTWSSTRAVRPGRRAPGRPHRRVVRRRGHRGGRRPGWDQVRFNVFPSRAAFVAVALDPARLAAQADHREPAIADTYTAAAAPRRSTT